MAREQRKALIGSLQQERGGRLLITYITSTRPNHEIQIADDAFRIIYDHLEAGKEAAKGGVDLFLHSNGGSGTVPWRIVNLIRQYTKHFAVLVPNHAFSAATLIALGADEILMHRMGCLGPIDPSVANIFNPPHPGNPSQPAAISVEDVTAFFKMVKEEIGITHEDELVQALIALTEKIHPLALGNVQRSHSQSRLMARKLLRLHVGESEEHAIETLIDNLKSNLFFHGHPINREEAKRDLKLAISDPTEALERMMWDLYKEYETELRLMEPFNPLREFDLRNTGKPQQQSISAADIIEQMKALAKGGIGLPGMSEKQLVGLAANMVPFISGGVAPNRKLRLDPILGACVESLAHVDLFRTDMTIEQVSLATPSGPQDAIKQEIIWQRWEREL
jgi:hypothetical protein